MRQRLTVLAGVVVLLEGCGQEEARRVARRGFAVEMRACAGRFCTAGKKVDQETLRAGDCLAYLEEQQGYFLDWEAPFAIRVEMGKNGVEPWGRTLDYLPTMEDKLRLHDERGPYGPFQKCEAMIVRGRDGETRQFAYDPTVIPEADWLSTAGRVNAPEAREPAYLVFWGVPEEEMKAERMWFFVFSKARFDAKAAEALAARIGIEKAEKPWCLMISNDGTFDGAGGFPWLNPLLVQFETRRLLEVGHHAAKWYLQCEYKPGEGFRCRQMKEWIWMPTW